MHVEATSNSATSSLVGKSLYLVERQGCTALGHEIEPRIVAAEQRDNDIPTVRVQSYNGEQAAFAWYDDPAKVIGLKRSDVERLAVAEAVRSWRKLGNGGIRHEREYEHRASV